jgi:arylsulfatase
MFSREAVFLAMFLVVLILPWWWISKIVLRGLRFVNKRMHKIFAFFYAWILVFFYVVSWVFFASSGEFLDRNGIALWSNNPTQSIQHIAQLNPYQLLQVPLVTTLVSVVLVWILWTPRFEFSRLRTVLMAFIVMIFGFVMVLVVGEQSILRSEKRIENTELGSVYPLSHYYQIVRDYRLGPLTHAWNDFRKWQIEAAEKSFNLEEYSIHRRPLITMNDYLNTIVQNKIHRWNVIILLVESLRTDQLKVLGGSRIVMPTIEKVAQESLVFTDNYTQSSHSNYSDIAPLSSHYPLRTKRYQPYPKDIPYPRVLIYDILKALQYRTAIFSSQNENWGKMLYYLDTGHLDHILHSETFKGETYVPHSDIGFARWAKGKKQAGKIDDRFTVQAAIDWIRINEEQPFFIYMNLQNSHVPYVVPTDFKRPFGPNKINFKLGFGYFPPHKTQTVKDRYADSLAYVDFQLSKLVNYLKSQQLWEKTIFIITGDTGQAFFEHGFASHASKLYNEVMQTPLIISAPSLIHKKDSRPAQHIDIPPSILDLLGLPPHPSFQGISLFTPQPPIRSRYLLSQALAYQTAIVQNHLKLIYDQKENKYFLYDLKNDPAEKKDLFNPKRVKDLTLVNRLHAWRYIQLNYYQNPKQYRHEYPPILID